MRYVDLRTYGGAGGDVVIYGEATEPIEVTEAILEGSLYAYGLDGGVDG
jgi:hypothetical protein